MSTGDFANPPGAFRRVDAATMRRLIAIISILTYVVAAAPTAVAATSLPAGFPIPGAVVRGFDAPEPDWKPGHRGVDLAGLPGDEVRAAAEGTVSYVGRVAGVDVVVVSHGELRTTYEPVTASVRVGEAVSAGQVIGVLQAGHPGCAAVACLHWGLKRGDHYLDPLSLVHRGRVRLLAELPKDPPPSSGPLRRPPGPVTSGFGMRVHPVLGTMMLHDGTDFGLGCGTPIPASGPGVVTMAGDYGGYGLTVQIDHGIIDGRRVVTLYGHQSAIAVRVGQEVTAGDIIGFVGTTGWSTGCHLHFGVYVDGSPVDPLTMTAP